MRVLKIVLEGTTTSFRYPHFMIGVQPTYPMPPPSTIYGHVCSTLGDWVDPHGLQFAYHFTSLASFEDLEHIHVLEASSGVLPLGGEVKYDKVLKGKTNPYRRALLFQPHLTLYLNRPEWEDAFRSPRYAVVLGRSQDVATYTSVSVLDLTLEEDVYLEHTLLPYDMATQTSVGIVSLMPQWIDYERNRRTTFARYLVLQQHMASRDLVRFESEGFLTDPTAPVIRGRKLGLVFHSFVEEGRDA